MKNMTLSKSLLSAIASVQQNPRLRWGVWSIAGILWLYGVLLLQEEVQKEGDAFQALNKKISRTEGIVSQADWDKKLKSVQAIQLDLESHLWREGTFGLAQASFHDWLTQALQQANTARALVAVTAQEAATPDDSESTAPLGANLEDTAQLWKVTAKISFDFSPQTCYPLLARFASYEKRIVVESLIIRGSPTPRVELVVVAYFQKPAGATGGNNNDRPQS